MLSSEHSSHKNKRKGNQMNEQNQMLGIIHSLNTINSKHGGIAYRTHVLCHDARDRIMWLDPKMKNFEDWRDYITVMEHEDYKDRCLVVDNLRVLKKDNSKLNADTRPTLIDHIDRNDYRIIKEELTHGK